MFRLTATLSIFIFALLISTICFGSHIVGGEITVTHLNNDQYLMRVNVYRDASGIQPPQSIRIVAYKRGSGTLPPSAIPIQPQSSSGFGCNGTGTWCLPKRFDSIVGPLTLGCQNWIITVERWFYDDTITISANVFNDPSGYIFTWESCCRNPNITNILTPSSMGQTMITLFPPVVNGSGMPIMNSSPIPKKAFSDYACAGQPFYVDFSAPDPDGDSVAYALYTPRDDGGLGAGVITPAFSPFADPMTMVAGINWAPTYGTNVQIHGASGPPDPAWDRLKIDPLTGLLTVTPRIPGNQLFGIWIKEYRDLDGDGTKELIGSVYRDYQLPVVNNCASPDTLSEPVVTDTVGNVINAGDTAHVTSDPYNRWVRFEVWDPGFDPSDPVGHLSTFEVDAVNFPDNYVTVTPQSYVFSSQFDTVTVQIDFSDCASTINDPGKPYPLEFRIVTKKWGCPLPYPDSSSYYAWVDSMPCTGNLSLQGKVTLDHIFDSTIQGEVYLLKNDPNSPGGWMGIDQSTIQNGRYMFDSLHSGSYHALAMLYPTDPNFNAYLPTYFRDKIAWTQADPVHIIKNTSGKGIHLVPTQGSPTGPNNISGSIIYGSQSNSSGLPVKRAHVLLLGKNYEPLDYRIGDPNGEFDFSFLADGSYFLKVEIPGIPHDPEYFVLPDDNNRTFNFLVNDNSVLLSGLDDHYLESQISIFPNPVNNILRIQTGEIRIEDLNISIQDVQGKTIGEFRGRPLLDLGNIDPGIYFLNIADQDSRLIKKLIIR